MVEDSAEGDSRRLNGGEVCFASVTYSRYHRVEFDDVDDDDIDAARGSI